MKWSNILPSSYNNKHFQEQIVLHEELAERLDIKEHAD